MEALIFDKKSKTLKYVKDRKVPEIVKDNDVIVKVEYSGVCGTDVHIIEGHFPCNDKVPFIMGHEFVGEVVQVGPAAQFKVGQKVVVDPNSGCSVCLACHNGRYHLCEEGGVNSTLGIWRDGGWAQYCRVPETQMLLLPHSVTLKQGALCEPLSCLAHGWDRAGRIPVGSSVLVMGAGIIGNLWAELLHLQGHKRVSISEPNDDRRNNFQKMKLGYTCMTPAALVSSGLSFDVIVDCTGFAPAMEEALPLLNPAGRYVIFGCCNPQSTVKINPFDMYKKELSIIAVNTNPFTFPKSVGLLEAMGDRYLDYEQLGIKVFKISEYEKAFKELKTGAISKAVFQL